MIASIARMECRSLLRSPQTWVLAAVLAVLFAFLFLQSLETYLDIQPQLALQDHPPGLTGFLASSFLAPLVMVFALVAPLLAMRSFSDEYRQQTLALWQSSPVSGTAMVLGKYSGILLVLFALVLLALLMPLSMRLFTPIDNGVLFSSALGLFASAAAFASIGMYFSSLTRHALVAVAAAVILLLLLWLLGSAGNSSNLAFLAGLAIPTHVTGFFQGYLSLADVAYFLLLTCTFLALTIVRLDALRHNGN